MSDSRAIFLSYASQDAEAALRIADALRGTGLEVWLDQSALRGGDAWDALIRKQVKECALFIPIISANTQAREEGYFRREWNLAVSRTLDMTDDKAFLLPVVIDATTDALARVPEKFRAVQWTRAPGGKGTEAFAERVRQLLGGASPGAGRPATSPVAARGRPAADAVPSIAVLPFANLSRDEENEYFADGLAEELLNVLSKIRGIRVASRNSTFWFKGKDADLATVAQKLGVATVLGGSVRKVGNRVRIAAQLVHVAKDENLWSGSYDRQLDDIFAVQDDIARAVVEELRTTLLGESASAAAASARTEVQAATTDRAENPEAHRLYLQGCYYVERLTRADVARGLAYLKEAVSLDPKFALGWTGLARARVTQAGFGWLPVDEGYGLAREAVQKAIALAPELAEGHVLLSQILSQNDWDWPAAEREARTALALAPGNLNALMEVGTLAWTLGRLDDAFDHMLRAIALDPLNLWTHRFVGVRLVLSGRLDEGEAILRAAIDLNPQAGLVHCYLSYAFLMRGQAEEALQAIQREAPTDFRLLGIVLAEQALGNAQKSDDALEEMIRDYGHDSAYQIAQACAWRGEIDRAFEWLERAYVQRDPGLTCTKSDQFLRPLHADPRFVPFLKKMRLVD
jgi:TolB-like protein/Tfp pilus assembly protein PilF